jgi:hypothetical protein
MAAESSTTEGPVKDTKPVAVNHRFDEVALANYMRTNVDGFSYAEKSARMYYITFTCTMLSMIHSSKPPTSSRGPSAF